jgi:5'-3' exonuclease
MYSANEFLILDLDKLKEGFCTDIHRSLPNHRWTEIQKKRHIDDYMFLTFMVGNDYVPSLYFMKMKKNGLELLISIYIRIWKEREEYLVDADGETRVNQSFLMEIWKVLGEREEILMREQYSKTLKEIKGHFTYQNNNIEQNVMEKWKTNFDHMNVCNPEHPLFKEYKSDFYKVNYMKTDWKNQYYKEYLNIDRSEEDFEENRDAWIRNYLESLLFTMEYYYRNCPSWTWHYRYRVAPLPSDVYEYLTRYSVNELSFEQGRHYTPFEQLMLILPPQMNFILPEKIHCIMSEEEYGCIPFYPVAARLDVSVGIKTIYSEMILPEIDEEMLSNLYYVLRGGTEAWRWQR